MRKSTNILELFENEPLVKVAAPMVRYSKLQFRNLLKHYDCDLCYTPMILADSFCQSSKARENEFTTNLNDAPLITQFAANTVHDFVGAACMVAPFCDGVDLNCGCPQRWARNLGLGCAMLEQPELMYDLIRQCRNKIPKPFTVSVKTRLCKDDRNSVEICKQLEMCGVSYLTIHARTPQQNKEVINVSALKLISENVTVPVIANGGINSLEGCVELKDKTNCKGVMVANGLLTNPTLFAGSNVTTVDCIQKWLDICYNTTMDRDRYDAIRATNATPAAAAAAFPDKPDGLTFQCFHHHLVFMLEKLLNKKQKLIFNNLQSFAQVLSYLEDCFGLSPRLFDEQEYENVRMLDVDFEDGDCSVYNTLKPEKCQDDYFFFGDYTGENEGKYFKDKIQQQSGDDDECDWTNMFLESG